MSRWLGLRRPTASPWWLVLGATGSGKSTLLARAGLVRQVPAEGASAACGAPDEGLRMRWQGLGGAWIECPGAWLDPEGPPVDGVVQAAACGPVHALRGIVVVVDLAELGGLDATEAASRGARVHGLAAALAARIERLPPLFVVATHGDALPAGAAWLADAAGAARIPCGATLDAAEMLEGAIANGFDRHAATVLRAVCRWSAASLPAARSDAERAALASLPIEWRHAQRMLRAWLIGAADGEGRAMPALPWRSWHVLGAAAQDEAMADGEPGPAAAARGTGRPALPTLSDLHRHVMAGDARLAGWRTHPLAARRGARRVATVGVAAGVVTMVLAWSWAGIEREREALQAKLRVPDAEAGAHPEALARLGTLQRVAQALPDAPLAAAWRAGLGAERLLGWRGEAVQAHQALWRSALLQPATERLETALAAATAALEGGEPNPSDMASGASSVATRGNVRIDVDRAAEAERLLQTYRALGRPRPADADALAQQIAPHAARAATQPQGAQPVRAALAADVDDARLVATRLAFVFGLRHMTDPPVPRPSLVRRAQAALDRAQRGEAAVALRVDAIQQHVAQVVPAFDLDALPAAARIWQSSARVPGAFTRAAWQGRIEPLLARTAAVFAPDDAPRGATGAASPLQQDAMRARHLQQGRASWLAFVAGLRMRPVADADALARTMGELSEAHASPVLALAARIQQEAAPDASWRTPRWHEALLAHACGWPLARAALAHACAAPQAPEAEEAAAARRAAPAALLDAQSPGWQAWRAALRSLQQTLRASDARALADQRRRAIAWIDDELLAGEDGAVRDAWRGLLRQPWDEALRLAGPPNEAPPDVAAVGMPSVETFELTWEPEPDQGAIDLDIEGQRQRLHAADARAARFVWPHPSGEPGVRWRVWPRGDSAPAAASAAAGGDGPSCPRRSWPGADAVGRWIDEAEVRPAADGTRLLRWASDDPACTVTLRWRGRPERPPQPVPTAPNAQLALARSGAR